jgi:hypothetical protein
MSKTLVILAAIGIAAFVAGVGHYHRYPTTRTAISSPH